MKYKIRITEDVAPGQPQVVLHLGNLRLGFTKKPQDPAATGQTDVHEVEVPGRELWRLQGLVEDGYEIDPPPQLTAKAAPQPATQPAQPASPAAPVAEKNQQPKKEEV